MKKTYFTIAGTNHYYGQKYFEPNMEVRLVKEPDNEYDKEAIKVEMEGFGQVGYVANSSFSVVGVSWCWKRWRKIDKKGLKNANSHRLQKDKCRSKISTKMIDKEKKNE